MAEITEQQADFVTHFVANGGNATQAARDAGYSEDSIRQIAYKLMRKPHILSAIQEEQLCAVTGRLGSKALAVLEAVMDDKDAPVGARVDAAKTVLDRGGLVAKRRSSDERSPEEKSMSEWSTDELQDFINDGMSQLRERKDQRLQLVNNS